MNANDSDLKTVADGIKKLPKEEALEVSLCLLNLLFPFARKDEEFQKFLAILRDRLLENS